jgi:methionine-rich copper-binding protein CopC
MAPGTFMGRLTIALWLVAAWILLSCSPALAHANLVEASPPQRGTVSKPPDRVELRFSEPVDAEFDPVVVRAAGGARVDAHNARVDQEDARIVLVDLRRIPEGSHIPLSGVSPP